MTRTGRLLALTAALGALAAAPALADAAQGHAASARRTLRLSVADCDTRQTPNTSTMRWRRGVDSPKDANRSALVAGLVRRACGVASTAESAALDLPLGQVGRLAFDFREQNPDAHELSTLGSRISLRMVTPDPTTPGEELGLTVDLVGAFCNHPMARHPGWGQAHFTTDLRDCTILVDDGSDYQQPYSADGVETAWQKLTDAYPEARIETAAFVTAINGAGRWRSFRYDRLSIGTGVLWSRSNWGILIRGR